MNLFWNKVLAGFVIGAGAIIPGLSGGILAVSMGLYQPTIEAIAGFFKKPKENIKFLLPLALGGIVGFILFLVLIKSLFADFRTEIICLFMGLVVGGIPSFLKEAKGDELKIKKTNWAFTAIGFVVAMALILLSFAGEGGSVTTSREITPLISMLCGGVVMIGVVLPGVSTSFVLINAGVYDNFMGVFTDLLSLKDGFLNNLVLALCALAGLLVVAVPMLLLVRKVLEKYHGQSYFALFGILLSTIVGCLIQEVSAAQAASVLLPLYRYLIYVALFAIGVVGSFIMEKSMQKMKTDSGEVAEAKELQS